MRLTPNPARSYRGRDAVGCCAGYLASTDGGPRAARTAEILLTFGTHGFGELVELRWRMRWLPGQPPTRACAGSDVAATLRLRGLLEAPGQPLAKIGQLLALHGGALPPACQDDLPRLLGNTLPLPLDVICSALPRKSAATGVTSSVTFTRLHWQVLPLVRCTVGYFKGRAVAIKVQCPGAHALLERDLDSLRYIVHYTRLHSLLRVTRTQIEAIVDVVIGFTRSEFDHCHEADAAERRKSFRSWKKKTSGQRVCATLASESACAPRFSCSRYGRLRSP